MSRDGGGPGASVDGQRLDKWLWAARFFKTRSAAAGAVNGGKVVVDGSRCKPARRVRPGTRLEIQRGAIRFQVIVLALNATRRPAVEAMRLYEETPESIAARTAEAARRAQAERRRQRALGRPDRRERRALSQLKGR